MRGSTKILVSVLAAPALAAMAVAPAMAHGPSGSSEEETFIDDEGNEQTVFTNEVECPATEDTDASDGGITIVTPLGVVFVGAPDPSDGIPEDLDLGAEICSDHTDSVPIDGRIIVGAGAGPLTNPGDQPIGVEVAADGDESNAEHDERAAGWARVDLNTRDGLVVRCGDSEGNLDSQHPNPELPDQDENPEQGDGEDSMEDCG